MVFISGRLTVSVSPISQSKSHKQATMKWNLYHSKCIYEIAHLQLKREKERNYWLECLADFIHCIFRLAIITDFHHLDVIVFGMVLAFTHRNEFVIWAFVFGLYRCSFRHVFLFLLSSGRSLHFDYNRTNTHLLLIYLFIILEYLIWRQKREWNQFSFDEKCRVHTAKPTKESERDGRRENFINFNLINTLGTANVNKFFKTKVHFF